MTFSTNVPNAAQSPGLFPAQANANWTRLKAIIDAEHVFNDTSPGLPPNTDGVHKQVTFIDKPALTVPVLPVGTNAELYTKPVLGASQLYYWNGITDMQLTPSRIVAMVNFNGLILGNNAVQTLRSAFNVTSVTRIGTATGSYKITFTNAFPNTNYVVQCTGMRPEDAPSNGCVQGNLTYASSVLVGSLNVAFFGGSDSKQNVLMGNVVVYSIT